MDAMLAERTRLRLSQPGGIRADIPEGPSPTQCVRRDALRKPIVVFEADGAFLRSIIEKRIEGGRHGVRVAGVEVVYSRKRPDLDRITTLLVGGQPLDPNKIYHIATSDYLMEGNAGLTMLTRVPEENITRLQTNLRDIMVNYIRKNSPVSARIDDRWKRDDKAVQANT
jgi:2',3'-cyclic-nucleotide 2'-phosphodiesterase (5'-nucleotidase family)